MTQRVREGVFFSIPVVLPRGRHDLTREQVLAAQRERLLVAMTELMAEVGYRAVKVGAVAAHAGVSRASFYESFPDKEACAFAAYDRFINVLLDRVAADTAGAESWEDFMAGLFGSYFGTLQEDLVVARAFQVEMDAVGPSARARRRRALMRFADVVEAQREHFGITSPLPRSAYLGMVYAARQVASDALDTHKRPDLVSLGPEFAQWVGAALAA